MAENQHYTMGNGYTEDARAYLAESRRENKRYLEEESLIQENVELKNNIILDAGMYNILVNRISSLNKQVRVVKITLRSLFPKWQGKDANKQVKRDILRSSHK